MQSRTQGFSGNTRNSKSSNNLKFIVQSTVFSSFHDVMFYACVRQYAPENVLVSKKISRARRGTQVPAREVATIGVDLTGILGGRMAGLTIDVLL